MINSKKIKEKAIIQGDNMDAWFSVIYKNKILIKDYGRIYAIAYCKGFNEALKQKYTKEVKKWTKT